MINHWVKTFLLITQLITHLLKNGSSTNYLNTNEFRTWLWKVLYGDRFLI